jgi:hypothetical protein
MAGVLVRRQQLTIWRQYFSLPQEKKQIKRGWSDRYVGTPYLTLALPPGLIDKRDLGLKLRCEDNYTNTSSRCTIKAQGWSTGSSHLDFPIREFHHIVSRKTKRLIFILWSVHQGFWGWCNCQLHHDHQQRELASLPTNHHSFNTTQFQANGHRLSEHEMHAFCLKWLRDVAGTVMEPSAACPYHLLFRVLEQRACLM